MFCFVSIWICLPYPKSNVAIEVQSKYNVQNFCTKFQILSFKKNLFIHLCAISSWENVSVFLKTCRHFLKTKRSKFTISLGIIILSVLCNELTFPNSVCIDSLLIYDQAFRTTKIKCRVK